jgi:hypothetical protein
MPTNQTYTEQSSHSLTVPEKSNSITLLYPNSSLVGRQGVWDLPFLNCRKFSYDRFEQIKKKYNLIESRPPLRQSFIDEIDEARKIDNLGGKVRPVHPSEF